MSSPAAVDPRHECRIVVLWQWLVDRGGAAESATRFEPVEYCVLRGPGGRIDDGIVERLVDLVERGLIRVVDLVAVTSDADGAVVSFELLADTPTALDGLRRLSDGTARDDDEPRANLRVYENVRAAPFATVVRRAGGSLLADGRISLLR
jgi:hypothetical protein